MVNARLLSAILGLSLAASAAASAAIPEPIRTSGGLVSGVAGAAKDVRVSRHAHPTR